MAENQPPTAPNVSSNNAEDHSALESVVSLLHAATTAAGAMPFGVDQAYLAVGLELAYVDALALLPDGSEPSPSAYEDREAMLARATETAAANPTSPSAGVVVLLGEALEILARRPMTTESRELASKVAVLHQDAKRGTFLPE